MKRFISIRRKVAIILVAAVVVPLVVAGMVLGFVIIRFHEDLARDRFEGVFLDFEQQLRNRALDTERTASALRERPDFVAELSLLSRYLDPVTYDQLLFDPVLRRLAQLLREQARAAGIDRLILYDGYDRLQALHSAVSPILTVYVEYRDGVPTLVPLDPDLNEDELARLPAYDSMPEFFQLQADSLPDGGDTFLRMQDNALFVETVIAVNRTPVGGQPIQVGTLIAGSRVGPDSSRFPDMPDLLMTGIYVPDQQDARIPESLSRRLNETEVSGYGVREPLFIQGSALYLSAVPLPLGSGEMVWVYATISRDLVHREARETFAVILAVLAISAGTVIPVGFYLERRYLGQPTQELMRGVTALRSGDYSARVQLMERDELTLLADAFNDMAATIQNNTATLEHKVKERTQELETMNAAKSRFLARMTHEIRNPMNGIMGMAQVLRADNLNPEQRDYVDIILASSQHLLGIVNDILDISKIEAGKLVLESEAFYPAELVRSVVELFKPQTAGKAVAVELIVHDEVPARVVGDSGRLRQVLANLVGNAAKFTDAGRILVRVSRDPEAMESDTVRLWFSVQDTGIGIASEQIAQLFGEYTQVYGRQGRASAGTGLGLSIAKELVELMGGQIRVQSELGKGSLFEFSAVFGRVAES